VPLARRTIARQRQSMLATMVQMGMQRIVIDSGRINASMRFQLDTRSVASEDRGSQFGMQNCARAKGSFGAGPWGVSAEVENTISYVSTQRSQATEEINTDLELNSSVELNFRTDYLPLNRMAAQAQADRIRNASLNPATETGDPAAARLARQNAQRQAEQQRREGLLSMPIVPTQPTPPSAAPPVQPTTPATPATPATPRSPGPGAPGAASRASPPGTTGTAGTPGRPGSPGGTPTTTPTTTATTPVAGTPPGPPSGPSPGAAATSSSPASTARP
jgi:hypothetical protein